jgi:acetoin utilization deacetylase AcuC-like enzyme
MIIHDERVAIPFEEYGIKIPQSDRGSMVLQALRQNKDLANHEEQWRYTGPLPLIGPADLERVHNHEYVRALFEDPEPAMLTTYELLDKNGNYHRYDPADAARPLAELSGRAQANAAGTCLAAERALDNGFCFFLGGGMHHATAEGGRGFCPVNDMVVAVRRLQAAGRIARAWIVDVDAHKGDGTAALCLDDPDTSTLSIHMARGWPLDRPSRNADGCLHPSFIPSTVDIPIEQGGEAHYLPALAHGLELLLSIDGRRPPDLAVVVDGSDAYEHDELPSASRLRLSRDQMLQRDLLVYEFLTTLDVPQAWVMAGGYGPRCAEVYVQFLETILARRLG